ncbi:S41 family peptidase [Candidatus Nesciobacter abundans]|uniref:Tricorn protease homolog n=1 Tax=Candidatus Nesciobacter abundans TaxID=2601668 RepID=A0A5C0UHF2_9PROT|nr:S41 family peptidase [Candidatus Nesciobacter abundans]QEK38983.1 hypothetical protein FZC36_00845 [Candidatus Nesciobacter abundans]
MISQYYRYPVGFGDTVYMVSHETLWKWSEKTGLNRWILLKSDAKDLSISKDGQCIAFTGSEESESDVYTIDLKTHKIIRRTFYGNGTYVVGWDSSDNIIFATNHGMPFKRNVCLNKLNLETGKITKLKTGLSNWISWNSKGSAVVQRFGYGYSTWRDYQGGTAGQLWMDSRGEFEKIPFEKHNALRPTFVNDELFFLSDASGCGNVCKYDFNTKNWKTITKHEDFYVKDLSRYGNNLIYSKSGEIFLYDTEKKEERKLEIKSANYAFEKSNFVCEDNSKFLTSFDINNEGDNVSCCIRGQAFSIPLWNKGYLQKTTSIRHRVALWSDNEKFLSIKDDKEDAVLFMDGQEFHRFSGIGRISDCKISKNNIIAAQNNRNEIWLLDLNSRTEKKILDNSEQVFGFDWSPDGKWFVFSSGKYNEYSSLKIYDSETEKCTEITEGTFKDISPKFDSSGKYLYFLSFRTFKTEYDPFSFNLFFRKGFKPYAVCLEKDSLNPFEPWLADDEEGDSKNVSSDSKNKNEDCKDEDLDPKDIVVNIDFENINKRIFECPVKASDYVDIEVIEDKLLLLESNKKLKSFTPGSKKLELVSDGISSFEVSRNKKWLLVFKDEKLRLCNSGLKFEESDSYKNNGWISLDSIDVIVEPEKEWKQMFEEVLWLTKVHFWDKSNEIDWDGIRKKYSKILESVQSRNELNILFYDMIGELKTSHAYVLEPGDILCEKHNNTGYLGATFKWNGEHYEINEIIEGDSWGVHSPIHQFSKGDVLISVNGRKLNENVPPESIVFEGKKTSLEIKKKENDSIKMIHVNPLKDVNRLAYQKWISERVDIIKSKTDKIGYVHIPNMVSSGYNEFYKRYIFEHRKAGLIVDARNNSGGHLSSLIIDKLQRKPNSYTIPRYGAPEHYPSESPMGPMVLICNENTGSDGDIFTRVFKDLNLGTVIGKRTWGGVVGIMPRYFLIDGGLTSQPEFATKMINGGYDIENIGVDPDIDVDNTIEDFDNGVDRQLEKAIELIMNKLSS